MRKILSALLLAALLVPASALAATDADTIRAASRATLLHRLERHAGDRAPLIHARLKAERQRLLALPDDRRFAEELHKLLVSLTGDESLKVAAPDA